MPGQQLRLVQKAAPGLFILVSKPEGECNMTYKYNVFDGWNWFHFL